MEDTRCFVSKLTSFTGKAPAFSLQTAAPLALAIVSNDNNPLAKIITHKSLRNKTIYLALPAGEPIEDAQWFSELDLSHLPDPNGIFLSYNSSVS